jgi:hypothetical protein
MASDLKVIVKTTNSFVISRSEWSEIAVDVSAKGREIKSATVTFAITNGKNGEINKTSCKTDKHGNCKTQFKANETGHFDITVTASKAKYNNGSFTIEILSLDAGTQFTDNGVLYLNLLEKRKRELLKVVSSYLDNDPEFYQATGASDRITYMTEWNFQNENFPLIVASASTPKFRFAGINNRLDDATLGGWANVTFALNLVAENNIILDRMIQKCLWFIGSLKYLQIYGQLGIHINLPLTASDVVTEPWGARLIYASKISINARIEVAHDVTAKDNIETITVDADTESQI